ncbi:urea ABC transporter permease subunit UrtB, partial [bacterium]|nr:urea ABC transporter permease subunit UrtB [bacterium]
MLKPIFKTFCSPLLIAWLIGLAASSISVAHGQGRSIRETIAAATVAATPAQQREIILSLKLKPTPETVTWFERWKTGEIFLYEDAAGVVTPVLLTGEPAADDSFATVRLADATPLLTPDGAAVRINPKQVEFAETDSGLRKAMKEVADLVALADPNLVKRIRAIQDSAIGQKSEKLPALQLLQTTEKNPEAQRALVESIAIIQLRSTLPAERIAACQKLGEIQSLSAFDTIKTILAESQKAGDKPMIAAAAGALRSIESHISAINAVGTAFRGVSLGSVLLVVAIGLAITFGLMGVINMAH